MNAPTDLTQRVAVSMALHRYLGAVERLEAASTEMQDASKAVRDALSRPCRFVANVSHQIYLVNTDRSGNVEIEQIESI